MGDKSGNTGCGEKTTLLQAVEDLNGEVVGHQDRGRGQGIESNVLTRASSGGDGSVVVVCVACIG